MAPLANPDIAYPVLETVALPLSYRGIYYHLFMKKFSAHEILPPAYDSEKVKIPPSPVPNIHIPSEEELDALQKLVEDMKRIEKENEELDRKEWEEENAQTLIKDLTPKKASPADKLLKICAAFCRLSIKL